MLRTSKIKYSFDSNRFFEFPDVYCPAGNSMLLLGPSGCGKSTWLHLICGLLKNQSGSIQVNGKEITVLKGIEMDHYRAKHIGVILQKPYFINSLNVLENLLLFQKIGLHSVDRNFALEILMKLGLHHKEKQRVTTLSQGELQRLNFARALINKPDLILADEPTSALDDYHADIITSTLKEQTEVMNAALIIVTHDLRLKKLIKDQVHLT